MHEFSIIMNVIDIVEENAEKLNALEVSEIEMDVGELSGIDIEALKFAMQCTKKSTVLENAILKINKIPGKAECKSCRTIFNIDDLYTACPNCNHFKHDILQGKELAVKSIRVNE